MLNQNYISPLILASLPMMLALAVFFDLKKRKIPNQLVMFGLVSSLVFQFSASGSAGGLSWILGVIVGFFCFFPLYLLRGMAAGDVKLMMAVGGFLGCPLVITAALYSLIAGGVMAVIYLFFKGKLSQLIPTMKLMALNIFVKKTTGQPLYNADSGQTSLGRMPYAQAIAAGTFIACYLKASTQFI